MLGYGIDLEESKLEKPSDFHLLFYGSIDGYKCSNGVAGLGSFLSPCILPILPGFISYLSGTAANEAKDSQTAKTEIERYSDGAASNSRLVQPVIVRRSARINIFLNTVYFILGFSLVFAVLGVLLNSVLIGVGNGFQHSLTSAGGLVIIGFGVYLILSTKL